MNVTERCRTILIYRCRLMCKQRGRQHRHLSQLPVLDKLAHMPHYMGSQSIDRADIEP